MGICRYRNLNNITCSKDFGSVFSVLAVVAANAIHTKRYECLQELLLLYRVGETGDEDRLLACGQKEIE